MSLYKRGKARFLLAVYFWFFIVGAYLTLGGFTLRQAQDSLTNISLYELGQIFGTLSLTGLTLQLWMGSRVKLLESGVGLPQIMKWHSLNGKLTFLFVLLHPLLMFGPLMLQGLSLLDILSTYTIYHWFGISALLLIIFTLVITIWQFKLGVNYEVWKLLHKVGYIIIFLGFTHSLFVGSDIVSKGPLYYWWWALLLMTLAAVVYKYGVRNVALKENLYKVANVVKENPSVTSIFLEPINKRISQHSPGQFAFVRFYSKDVPNEEHHFTIASPPGQEPIAFTVKGVGDYTQMLGNLKTGDTARIEGPFGVFSNEGLTGPFVFIAGGIGITPIMSMLRAAAKNGGSENTLLIYAAKTAGDLVFKKEIDELAKKTKWFRVVYRVGDHIDDALLQKEVKDFQHSKFFICGPLPMMNLVEKLLAKHGVGMRNIFTEKFSLK